MVPLFSKILQKWLDAGLDIPWTQQTETFSKIMSQFKQLLSPLFRRFRGSTKNVEQAELKEDNLDSKENNLEDQDRRQVSNLRGKIQKFRRIFLSVANQKRLSVL